MVEPQPSKLVARVRFPSPAPHKTPFRVFSFSLSLGNLCSNLVAFALRLNSPFLTESRLRFFVHWTRLPPFLHPLQTKHPFRVFSFLLSLGNLRANLVAFIQLSSLTQTIWNVFLLSHIFCLL